MINIQCCRFLLCLILRWPRIADNIEILNWELLQSSNLEININPTA